MLRRSGVRVVVGCLLLACSLLACSLLGCDGQPSQGRRSDSESNSVEASLVAYQGEEPSLESVPESDLEAEVGLEPSGAPASPMATLPSFVVQPYSEWGLQETVVDSLGRIGSPAVPALERMLRHPDAERRVQAANILARIGPQAEGAVPGLVDALADQDHRVRKAAARALGQIGIGAADAVGPLLHVLEEASAVAQPLDSTLR